MFILSLLLPLYVVNKDSNLNTSADCRVLQLPLLLKGLTHVDRVDISGMYCLGLCNCRMSQNWIRRQIGFVQHLLVVVIATATASHALTRLIIRGEARRNFSGSGGRVWHGMV